MMLLLQDPLSGLPAAAQWGVGALGLAVLVFAVNAIRQITKEGADRATVAAKESADRAAKAQENCDSHNRAVVSEFSTTVCKMSDAHRDLVCDMRAASERREDKLHDLVREIRSLQPKP